MRGFAVEWVQPLKPIKNNTIMNAGIDPGAPLSVVVGVLAVRLGRDWLAVGPVRRQHDIRFAWHTRRKLLGVLERNVVVCFSHSRKTLEGGVPYPVCIV